MLKLPFFLSSFFSDTTTLAGFGVVGFGVVGFGVGTSFRGFFGNGGVPGGVPGSFDFLDQILAKSSCILESKIFLSFQIPTRRDIDLTVFSSKLRAVKCSSTFFKQCPNSFENSGAFLREFCTTSFAKYRNTSL